MSELLTHAEALWPVIVPDLPGFTVEVLPSIDSTNSELMRRARSGWMEPVLLVAHTQTAGRGRLGKGWYSQAGQSLTFSLALPLAPQSWSGLSLAVGVSLADSLHPALRLKWPNDLWLDGRKLGGVLVETAHSGVTPAGIGPGQDTRPQRLVVVGVGLNIARPPADPVQALATPDGPRAVEPAGLSEVCVGQTAGETLARIVPALVQDLLRFQAEGFGAFLARFEGRDALRGQPLQLSDGRTGLGAGVAPDGALLLQTPQGREAISSSEVSVRPC
jgi:BirA family biotin operon repressor/biotin-[acetyl-CoA-carboxylase] ligase